MGLLSNKLMLCTGGSRFEYVGSITKACVDAENFDSSAEALIGLTALTEVGDLIVVALSFSDRDDSEWSWNGISFTPIYDNTGSTQPGAYVGYHLVTGAETDPYVTGASLWQGLSVVACVFRGVSNLVSSGSATGASGNPNPPSLTAAGDFWVVTGHISNDPVSFTAPTGYTIADQIYQDGVEDSSTVIAYKIKTLSSDDPDAFTSTGTDYWASTTIAFD